MAIAAFAAGASAQAADEADLSARSHAMAARSVDPPAQAAPFSGRADPMVSILRAQPGAVERGVGCADAFSAVCYDARDRGLVYRGARGLMPHVQGLTAEGVALRHDRVILRYSFR
jgi:hypothetical protein